MDLLQGKQKNSSFHLDDLSALPFYPVSLNVSSLSLSLSLSLSVSPLLPLLVSPHIGTID